jgi:hypothetical protein
LSSIPICLLYPIPWQIWKNVKITFHKIWIFCSDVRYVI